MSDARKRVLFICTHNSARSQMAEGLMNSLMRDRYIAFSAGTRPGKLNPYAVQAMSDIGIDISHHRTKGMEGFDGEVFDVVVTVCSDASETCPFFPGREHIHHAFDDPSTFSGTDEGIMDEVARVRDDIRAWIKETFH